LSRPNKRPRVRCDDEVSLYWSSDDDDVEMFLDNSAGPSSRCVRIASPLDATNLFPSGYNALLATIETTTSIVPYVENIICCPNVISDFAAEDHVNRVDWILDSGASLHFTGDIVRLPTGPSANDREGVQRTRTRERPGTFFCRQ